MTLVAPWPYSEDPKPGEPTVPNEPTSEGRELGANLARLADIEERAQAQRLSESGLPALLPRCSDCALRAGTVPNGCVETLMDVIKCAIEQKPFYCHKGIPEGGAPKVLCRGSLVLSGGRSEARAAFFDFVEQREREADARRRERNRRKAQRKAQRKAARR